MNRRHFLSLLVIAPVSAFALAAAPKSDWTWKYWRDHYCYRWEVSGTYIPTGQSYGWRVSEEFLVDRNMTIEDVIREQQAAIDVVREFRARN